MTKPIDWEKRHNDRIDAYARQIELLYQAATAEAVRIAGSAGVIDPAVPFRFDDYPQTANRMNKLLVDLVSNTTILIASGTTSAWELSNLKNDALVQSLFAGVPLPALTLSAYNSRNLEALAAFQSRKVGGLGLSDRIWTYSGQLKTELELALDVGIASGKSAAALSRDVRSSLAEPDRLFRRVRDTRGNLQLSKAAGVYKPGQGVYRSSYKNALRLTRTEINSAYRTADFNRYQQLDFIVGFEVKRSNNKTDCDVCESLKGAYPKTFKFTGWHQQCRCRVISILATAEELQKLTEMVLNGEDTSTFNSTNKITDVHPGFTNWISENKNRLLNSKSLPFFMSDNLNVPQLSQFRR